MHDYEWRLWIDSMFAAVADRDIEAVLLACRELQLQHPIDEMAWHEPEYFSAYRRAASRIAHYLGVERYLDLVIYASGTAWTQNDEAWYDRIGQARSRLPRHLEWLEDERVQVVLSEMVIQAIR